MAASLTSPILADWLRRASTVFAEQRDHLTQLDSDVGDGDHGANLVRGFQAIMAKLPSWESVEPAALFKNVAMTLIGTVGGASGPLYGSFFLDASKAAAGKTELGLEDWTAVLEAGVGGVRNRGKAEPGDKTMLDALTPAVDALRDGGEGVTLVDGLRRSAEAAQAGAKSTEPLVARKGRASYLGDRSAGHLDPGAVSSSLLLAALADAAAA